MLALICEILLQTCMAVSFQFTILCLHVLTGVTWKLQGVYGPSKYWTTALLLQRFLVWFRLAWEISLESYGPWHIPQSFCDTTLCAYFKQKQNNRRDLQFYCTLIDYSASQKVCFCVKSSKAVTISKLIVPYVHWYLMSNYMYTWQQNSHTVQVH